MPGTDLSVLQYDLTDPHSNPIFTAEELEVTHAGWQSQGSEGTLAPEPAPSSTLPCGPSPGCVTPILKSPS